MDSDDTLALQAIPDDELLRRLCDLVSHSRRVEADLAAVIERAVTEKLERLEARRFGETTAPRTRLSAADTSGASRHIPAAVRRAVHERDGSRCRFVDDQGRRCSEHQEYPETDAKP